MHMLVAVDKIGSLAQNPFEAIQLTHNLVSHLICVQATQIGADNQFRYRQVQTGLFHGFGKIQVQAHLQAACLERRRIGAERRPFDQTTGGIQAPQPGQTQYRRINTGIHAKIVGADHHFFAFTLNHHVVPLENKSCEKLSGN